MRHLIRTTLYSLFMHATSFHFRASLVEWLLKAGPCVKIVHLGSTAQVLAILNYKCLQERVRMIYKVTDETFRSLCNAGHLTSMEEFQLERSGSLSLETLNTFLCHCPNIR